MIVKGKLTLLACTLVFVSGRIVRAGTEPEPARSADDFVESIGVNTHFGVKNSPYVTAHEQANAAAAGGDDGLACDCAGCGKVVEASGPAAIAAERARQAVQEWADSAAASARGGAGVIALGAETEGGPGERQRRSALRRSANPVGFRKMHRFDSTERPDSRSSARRVLVEAGRCGILAVECSRRSRTGLPMVHLG